MSNFATQSYTKRLRSQIPYYQASTKEIVEDLKLLDLDLSSPSENLTYDTLPKPRKRARPIILDNFQAENDAVDGLSALIAFKKPVKKAPINQPTETKVFPKPTTAAKAVPIQAAPQARINIRTQQLAQMQQFMHMMQINQNPYLTNPD